MKKLLPLVLLSACGYPAFTSSMRDAHFPPGVPVEGKCVHAGRNDLEQLAPQLYAQGWRLVYASEYTSTARPGFPSNYCFERAQFGAAPPPQQYPR